MRCLIPWLHTHTHPIVEGELKPWFPSLEDSHYRDLLSDLRHHPAFELNERRVRSVAAAATTHADRPMPLLCSQCPEALTPGEHCFSYR